MKSLNKNITSPEASAQIVTILSMQQQLALACLRQNLKLSTSVGHEEGKDLPYLQYTISFNTNEPPVFHGQARSAQEPHYATMFELINGKMVNETFPPTQRTVQLDTDEGSAAASEVAISYWKRRLVVEHDITTRDPDPKASQTDGLHKVASKAVWVGYDTKQREIVRIEEGTTNENPENVDSVQYMNVGQLGTVVIVIFKDTRRLTEGEQGTFAEGLKTAMTGFSQGGQSEGSADLSASSGGGAVLMSPPQAALSSSASSGSVAAISKLDLSGMAVKSPTLKEAISRLSKAKRNPTAWIPKTMNLTTLQQILKVAEPSVIIRIAAEVGVKAPTMRSRIGQEKAKLIAEKFGYKAVLMGEDGATAETTTKAPAKKATSRASAPVKKPAGKRNVKSND